MASSQGYLEYVLDLLSGVEGLTTRKMMGEYLLYSEGTLFGGVYDDRLLIKETPASASALGATAVPYEGARPMRLVDSDDGDALSRLVGAVMASSQGYLEYVLDLLSGVEGLTTRKMMGEYLLYSEGTLFGGVYDDRLLIKETPASASALGTTAVPYEGARPLRLVDSDDGDALSRLVGAVCAELRGGPARRARR